MVEGITMTTKSTPVDPWAVTRAMLPIVLGLLIGTLLLIVGRLDRIADALEKLQ
jgi:hypothetical protein